MLHRAAQQPMKYTLVEGPCDALLVCNAVHAARYAKSLKKGDCLGHVRTSKLCQEMKHWIVANDTTQ